MQKPHPSLMGLTLLCQSVLLACGSCDGLTEITTLTNLLTIYYGTRGQESYSFDEGIESSTSVPFSTNLQVVEATIFNVYTVKT